MASRISTPVSIKNQCLEMKRSGKSNEDIYQYYIKETGRTPEKESFFRLLRKWNRKIYPDNSTLESGTYKNFTAHDATVQVSSDGEIIQAWIKQSADAIDPEDYIEAIRNDIIPYTPPETEHSDANYMLEIPLWDMHWGVCTFADYEPYLEDILEIICSRQWDKIAIPFGQDFFHNDSIARGITTKGTIIERVDMKTAVYEALRFMYTLIENSIEHCKEFKMMYSPGNHDYSSSWLFLQILAERYGRDKIDDTLEFRKILTYGRNAIMVTHGDSKQATPSNLAHIFPITFPEEFANSDVREVHAGHLHTESETDVYGVMVRRLSSAVKPTEWTDREDFIGSHRRFMVFEWDSQKLRSIHYI